MFDFGIFGWLLGFFEKIVERGARVVGCARDLLDRGGRLMVYRSGIPRHSDTRFKQIAIIGLILDGDSHGDGLKALEASGGFKMGALFTAM